MNVHVETSVSPPMRCVLDMEHLRTHLHTLTNIYKGELSCYNT